MNITRRNFSKAGLGAISLAAMGAGSALAGPEHMIRKAIPSSGEMVPVIGLGTNRFGVGDDLFADRGLDEPEEAADLGTAHITERKAYRGSRP